MASHQYTITLSESERDAVAANVGGVEGVQHYLESQIAAVVEDHVKKAKKAALRADGLPEKLAEVGLADDEIAALKTIRADKRTAAEAAKAAAEGSSEK